MAALKATLAEKFGNNRQAYSEAKAPFCERIDCLARAKRLARAPSVAGVDAIC